MKKKILSLILCFSLMLACFSFVGCNNGHSKEDVAKLYVSMQQSENTKDFFDNNSLMVSFSDVPMNETDKSYIFEGVYKYYLKSSSCLFFNVVDRFSRMASVSSPMAYTVKDFTGAQINDIYNKLSIVNERLTSLNYSKQIYELTNAELHYYEVLNDYNSLIKSLYNLNFAFANYYFNGVGHVDFSKEETELSDSNMKDMFGFILLTLSKVTFNYEVVNFSPTNPLGSVQGWITNSPYMKDYLTLCKATLANFNNADLTLKILSPHEEDIKAHFANMQRSFNPYEVEYNCFLGASEKFNLKKYFVSANREVYLENSSNMEKSNFHVMNNFLNGRYKNLYYGLQGINSWISL